MSPVRVLDTLETDRLILRQRRAEDATVHRQLWTERDPRVPAHRRIDEQGRPTLRDIAGQLSAGSGPRPGLLAVQRKDTSEVIGYCGLIAEEHGSADEPELAFELLRASHNNGYATEAATAVLEWARTAGYQRLCAGVWDWNIASRRVLEKLGFRERGKAGPSSAHGENLLTVCEL